jgi:hypothetical protein
MKINLLINSNEILNGYINVDPLNNQLEKIKGDVHNLDWLCEDAECNEIIAKDIISYFPINAVDSIIEHWIKKLRHKGIINIGGVDLTEIARGIISKNIDLVSANILFYGKQTEEWQVRKSGLTARELVLAIKRCGLRIMKSRVENYYYMVQAQRL